MIVEANAHFELLSETLAAGDGLTVTIERFHAAPELPLRSIFWAYGPSALDLDDHLPSDPTVTDAIRLSTADGAALYRAHHPTDLAAVESYNAAITSDVLLLDATGTADGWSLQLWVPDRDRLGTFRDRCSDAGVRLEIRSMYDDDPQPIGELYGLTDPQREIMLQALRTGYFNIPRDVSLSGLAGDLSLSSQAASERLRRGMRTLVRNVLDDGHPATDREFTSDEE
jgi:hypothetical protein